MRCTARCGGEEDRKAGGAAAGWASEYDCTRYSERNAWAPAGSR